MSGPSVRARLSAGISSLVVSEGLRETSAAARAALRRLRGRRPRIDYFHQCDDPYSALALQFVGPLAEAYDVEVRTWLVPPPAEDAAPERALLADWSLRDAERIARDHGLKSAAWSQPPGLEPTTAALAEGEALRRKLGHYLGAVFHFEGEWFWGVDRLPYLEERLTRQGLSRGGPPLVKRQAPDLALARRPWPGAPSPKLDFYVSFRSPYTLIAAERIGALAEAHGADLRLKLVLPMVMRGLPVPRAKSLYIMRDAAREAARFGIPFGRMVDPRGLGAEQGLAVLHRAIALGRGLDFARAFLRGVFAEGRDSADPDQVRLMAAAAGLSRRETDDALADPSWKKAAQDNRAALFDLGLWGVPSFQVDDRPGLWGQDRLHHVQQDLIARIGAAGQH
jgi:2-hydroxychromene-2-carboxylate isomerase